MLETELLLDHSGGDIEDMNVKRNAIRGGPAHKGSKENKDSIRNWAVGHLYDSSAKNLSSSHPCPENFSDIESKG